MFTAPKEFKDFHRLGKAPIVTITKDNGEVITLAESGHVCSYFLRHYDTNKKLLPNVKNAEEKVDYFLHYLEGTLMTSVIGLVVTFSTTRRHKHLRDDLQNMIGTYFLPELRNNLLYLTEQLKKSSGPYFLGDKLSVVDIYLSYPFSGLIGPTYGLFTGSEKKLEDDYPELAKWMETLKNEPGRIKAYSNINLNIVLKL